MVEVICAWLGRVGRVGRVASVPRFARVAAIGRSTPEAIAVQKLCQNQPIPAKRRRPRLRGALLAAVPRALRAPGAGERWKALAPGQSWRFRVAVRSVLQFLLQFLWGAAPATPARCGGRPASWRPCRSASSGAK